MKISLINYYRIEEQRTYLLEWLQGLSLWSRSRRNSYRLRWLKCCPFEFSADSQISIKVTLFIVVVMAALSLFWVLWDCLSWLGVYEVECFCSSLVVCTHKLRGRSITTGSSGSIVNFVPKLLSQFVIQGNWISLSSWNWEILLFYLFLQVKVNFRAFIGYSCVSFILGLNVCEQFSWISGRFGCFLTALWRIMDIYNW